MSTDHERLRRLLGAEDLAWLVNRIRRRLERGEPLDTSITLTGATPVQRAAVHRLLGRRPRPGTTLTVSLPVVDELLRHSGTCPDGLTAAVVALTGPVTEQSVAAAALETAWQQAFAPLDVVIADRPALGDWYARLHATGLVRRLTGAPEVATPILADLAAVLRHLPAGGEPLGHFAARFAGGAHALDDNRPLTTLALGAARALTGLPEGTGAGWRREVWAAVGLLRDELSTTVLTLGLPGDAKTATGRTLRILREAGQPSVLTLRQLVRDPPHLTLPVVSICENPVVVSAAANRLGACAPLVCTYGQPGAAVMHLLRRIATAGSTLRYHGDFDWGGIRIGNVLYDRLPVQPWHFDTTAYRAAAATHPGRPLTGAPVPARWDPGLASAMTRAGLAVEEELVLDHLIDDLRI